MALKDWGSLAISVLAVAVSATTAYYNLFRVSHNASVVLGADYGIFTPFENRGLVSFATDRDLVFINNGTHPIAVVGMEVVLYQIGQIEKSREDCEFAKQTIIDRGRARPTEGFSPFVVSAKDVKIIRPTFALNPGNQPIALVREGEDPRFIFRARNDDQAPNFVSCLRIEFVPAGGQLEAVERPVFYTIGEGSTPGPFNEKKPVRLLKRTEWPL